MSSKDRTLYQFDTNNIMRKPSKICALRAIFSTLRQTRIKSRALLILLFALLFLPMTSTFFEDTTVPSNSEPAFKLAAETPTLTLSYYSLANPSFTPLEAGDRAAGDHVILNATWIPKDNVNGTTIQINASAIPRLITAESNTNSVEIDTRLLGNNATCTVNVTTWLWNGTALTEIFTNVFFGNFFVPHVTLLTPNGGETWPDQHNITWTAWDRNKDDILSFEVLISSDSGTSFQLLSSEITNYYLVWDFSPFQNLSTYVVEVRVSDGIYTSSDKSDLPFIAGTVASSTTSTGTATNTEPTSPPLAEDTRLALFIAAAIITSAFLSLIVYHQAKRLS
ncbi:MAG: hypothetical protein P1Q69_08205 [Candidatus Thorarchaeota archaeon]|nr:hypothetical protein [Candidatus Thorarchaeota archaeon]